MISCIKNKLPKSRQKMILRILSLGLLFLVLTGNGVAQQNDDSENTGLFSQLFKKKPNNSGHSNDSSHSSKNSLLPSSWFHSKSEGTNTDSVKSKNVEKQNNTPQPVKSAPAASALTVTQKPNTEQFSTIPKMLDDFSSDDLNIAPLPPEHPYYEKNRTQTAERNNRQSVSITESAQLPAPDTVPDSRFRENGGSKSPDEPMITGLSSYSFDTRDWVESFPVDHVSGSESYFSNPSAPPNTVRQDTSRNGQHEYPVQTVAVNERVPASIPASRQNTSPAVTSQWDGQTTPISSEFPKLASANRSVLDGTKTFETAQQNIDLSPSYTARLKYAEVYGVVVVQSNFPLTEIKSILEEIKQLQIDLNAYMGVSAPKEKIELCLFRDEKTYLKFLQEVFPNAPRDRRALYIKIDNKPGTLLVQKTDEFEVDLRHEMTHAIIHASIANVPIWLDEGLAKYFEVPISDRAEKNPYMKQIRWNTRFGAVPALARLEKLEHIGQMGSREYRDSWAWVHFLIHHSPQTHRLLAGYLQMLSTLPAEGTKEQDSVQIPPLSPYLEHIVKNPREKYREHFKNQNAEEN